MSALSEDLRLPKQNLEEFKITSARVLNYLPNIITERKEYNDYLLYSSNIQGNLKYSRPINSRLFIKDARNYEVAFKQFIHLLSELNQKRSPITDRVKNDLINKVVYTTQQSLGVGMDFLINPNSARKHIGNRFEEFIRLIIQAIGVNYKKIVLKIPYESEKGKKIYRCETDLVFTPHDPIRSTNTIIDKEEIVVSLKTSSKDRMGKIFIDKILMQNFVGHEIKHIGIFLNDVQRKESDKVSFTFVPGLFLVYNEFLVKMEGIYFIDLPPKAKQPPYTRYIFPFSKFVTEDVWNLINLSV